MKYFLIGLLFVGVCTVAFADPLPDQPLTRIDEVRVKELSIFTATNDRVSPPVDQLMVTLTVVLRRSGKIVAQESYQVPLSALTAPQRTALQGIKDDLLNAFLAAKGLTR